LILGAAKSAESSLIVTQLIKTLCDVHQAFVDHTLHHLRDARRETDRSVGLDRRCTFIGFYAAAKCLNILLVVTAATVADAAVTTNEIFKHYRYYTVKAKID